MNTLETFLRRKGLDENETVNLLQEHGVISDNCESARDVAMADCAEAIDFLLMKSAGLGPR